jgi:hypothetical protein
MHTVLLLVFVVVTVTLRLLVGAARRRARRVVVGYGLYAHGRERGASRVHCRDGHVRRGGLHVHGCEALVERGDYALDARDDLVVGHRKRVDVQAEHLGNYAAEVEQLERKKKKKIDKNLMKS